MELGGLWRAAEADDDVRRDGIGVDTDDRDWVELEVPGHWQDHPAFADSQGPVMYRRRFDAAEPGTDRRRWVTLDGIFYQADVWLDGAYLGDPEGYFFPHTFDITQLARFGTDHVLAVEVTCSPELETSGRRNLTGVHQPPTDDPANPGGLWRPVHVFDTGPARIDRLRVLCRDADERRAHLRIAARIDIDRDAEVVVRTLLDGVIDDEVPQFLAKGHNEIEWTVDITDPALWWPRALGDQPLLETAIEVVVDGEVSDRRSRRTGLRQIVWDNWTCSVNGERLFLKGANLLPLRRSPGHATAADVEVALDAAGDLGLDALRVQGHIGDRALYRGADERGILLLQDFPLQWSHVRSVRSQAVDQARAAVDALGHHPSIAMWSAHGNPSGLEPPAERDGWAGRARSVARQQLPTWNRTVLDRWVKRSFERADSTRQVIAHSGVLPHLPRLDGTDSHLWFGWRYGDADDLARFAQRLPRMVRFVTEFGADAAPDDPDAQRHQADLLKVQIEALRRIKYRPTGGFCFSSLLDSTPGTASSVLALDGTRKLAYDAVRDACVPLLVVAEPMPADVTTGAHLDLAIHVISDRRDALDFAVVDAIVRSSWTEQTFRFGGPVPADDVANVGQLQFTVPDDLGPLTVELQLTYGGETGTNRYTSTIVPPP